MEGSHRLSVLNVVVLLVIISFLPHPKILSAGHAASRPSAFCHVSDGNFTVCPDGHREWSDVPFVAFPETKSFLYADQADLDPNRATSLSPVDTFVLMYDDCGRTTPLGPNEYVLVNLKTVETKFGADALRNYVVHVFTDGTIIFFENGFLRPPGRAQTVEGMAGAVGFGPSPNCPFNHVTAEFQIELSAAGGHSYSPDPLFWSSTTPSPPSPTPQPTPQPIPQITNIFLLANKFPIEMGDDYNVGVRVVDQANAFVNVAVREASVNGLTLDPRFGDKVRGSATQGVQLSPGVPTDLVFPDSQRIFPYSHRWQYLGAPLSDGCRQVLEIALGLGDLHVAAELAIHKIFTDTAKRVAAGVIAGTGLSILEAALVIRDALEVNKHTAPEGLYRYDARADDGIGGIATAILNPISVTIPQYKRDAFTGYWVFPLLSALSTGVGVVAAEINPALAPFLAPILIAEVVATFAACVDYGVANDPDQQFTEIASPQPIHLPALDALPQSTAKQLAQGWLQVLVDKRALGVSLTRYEGAKEAGSTEGMIQQLQAAQGLQADLMTDLLAVRTLTTAFVNSPEAQAINLTPTDVARAQAQLIAAGLPQVEQDALSQLGLTSAEIAEVASITTGLMPFLPLDWREGLRSGTAAIIASSERMGAWIDQRLLGLAPAERLTLIAQGPPMGPITTDGANLFVGSGNSIFSVPIDGGTPTILYPGATPCCVVSLVSTGGNLFWIDPNGDQGGATAIFRGSTSGGPITKIYSGSATGQPIVDGSGLATDGVELYTADEVQGRVHRMELDGSGITFLGSRYGGFFDIEHLNRITIRDEVLYIADFGRPPVPPQVVTLPTASGSPFTTLFSGPPLVHPTSVAVGNGKVFVADAAANNTIWEIPTTGGQPSALISGAPLSAWETFNDRWRSAERGS